MPEEWHRLDAADVEQILRSQSGALDRLWIEDQLIQLYWKDDPRVLQWRELCEEVGGSSNNNAF